MTEFEEAVKHNDALRANLSKVQEDMNPIRVLGLFERISKEDCDLLDIHDRCALALGCLVSYFMHDWLTTSIHVVRVA